MNNLCRCLSKLHIKSAIMKRYMVIWGALFFLVMFSSLYLMLETVSTANKPTELNTHELDNIEGKIQRIEEDLMKNHETIKEIKDTVRKIGKGGAVSLDQLKDVLDRHKDSDYGGNVGGKVGVVKMNQIKFQERKDKTVVKDLTIPTDMCLLADAPEAKTDYKLTDVFEKNSFTDVDGGVWKQGWPITYDNSQWSKRSLKVFVIPHSHTDPGWLKTFMEYYRQQTKLIFENMIPKLEEDGRRKFMYAEMSFFSLWWDEIDIGKKERVKKLIENGQLEIVTGGWVMTDEANAHYFAMIDQLLEGHQWLDGTLGVKPKSGWSIDPFGYSSTMAYILREADFSNMLIQRVHYSLKKYLAKEKALEFMWRQQWDQEGSTDIFCHMMPFYSYDAPHSCGPDPKICCQFDFMRLPNTKFRCPWKLNPLPITEGNVAERVNLLIDQYKKKAQLYKTDTLLVPLGDDFRYDTAGEWDLQFQNYQKMIDYINHHPELKIEVHFGTLSDYFNAVYERTNVEEGGRPPQVPTLSGDFFTYADREDNYWSGYYTSRPFYKNLDRVTEVHLRAAEIIYTTALGYARKHASSNFPSVAFMKFLVDARRNLGLFQHHDGITGTSKEFVVADYGKRLVESINNMKKLIAECATYLSVEDKAKYSYTPSSPIFNIDELRKNHDSLPEKNVLMLTNEPSPVLMYNSLTHVRQHVVKVYVSSPYVEVKDPSGEVIQSQVEPYWTDKEKIATDIFKVSFVAEVPGLGISCYYIKQVTENDNPKNTLSFVTIYHSTSTTPANIKPFPLDIKTHSEDFTIENDYLKISFTEGTSMLKTVNRKEDEEEHKVSVEFVEYSTRRSGDKSGAYLFLPEGVAKPVPTLSPFTRIVRGPVISEVQVFTHTVNHVVRLINSPGTEGQSVDMYNIVDIRQQIDKEIAVRITTDIKNEDRVFYTDLNGYQMSRRKTYDKLPLQANFYPMPAMMFLEDSNTRFSVLSAQSLGCSSLQQGVMEVMMDRRLSHDDSRGLGEGVKDNKATPNRFKFLIESRKGSKPPSKTELRFPSLLGHLTSAHMLGSFFVLPQYKNSKLMALTTSVRPLDVDLPCELYMLNLRTMQNKDDSDALKYVPKETAAMILHRYGIDCSYPAKSLTCYTNGGKVAFAKIFNDLKMLEVKSMSLTLMYERENLDMEALTTVKPMEINTFKVTFRSSET
ncbi:alpha-mannosidase 2x [Patella vulgata]|uniref:alpha-mannosidase 2x n=1 Tax=Patella vulgata TaxID=6465 RepID=UPI00217FAD76|nr:alpha-mannosidase 2x [Patella vulgata]